MEAQKLFGFFVNPNHSGTVSAFRWPLKNEWTPGGDKGDLKIRFAADCELAIHVESRSFRLISPTQPVADAVPRPGVECDDLIERSARRQVRQVRDSPNVQQDAILFRMPKQDVI